MMKFTIASLLLAASSAVAAPTTAARPDSSLSLVDFTARVSETGRTSTISWTLYDSQNYPNEDPTSCELIWGPNGGAPREDACENGQYLVRFVDSSPNINDFTLQFERSGPIAEQGQVAITQGPSYACHSGQGQTVCNYFGVVQVNLK